VSDFDSLSSVQSKTFNFGIWHKPDISVSDRFVDFLLRALCQGAPEPWSRSGGAGVAACPTLVFKGAAEIMERKIYGFDPTARRQRCPWRTVSGAGAGALPGRVPGGCAGHPTSPPRGTRTALLLLQP